ncbi:MAG TPA: hypothetical protein DCY48_00290 [Candidatus Magasanikbacteria bacterium]|nr:MAG: hypothetical protein A3I74_01755 [Candidatus Magasanikbacteria bacterium RIFCSPLOWO2_02_FULL_47_16]OGH79879.1 MAG: hypothetical protein A3C10_00255 [Candidatus Magasanikbacteria bacterium RIFCSPHIGHO2_02_FULL_48_18]OGH82733.1 MAG: hypothetical protein A3G08_00870 [Candidatus Magasanikbacteria bacterium RIFCSPLOWO2_12_FULL_47_9b]HAZ28206.1 hypothetical protein [Candidatus Magasanikbacteria bacterium]
MKTPLYRDALQHGLGLAWKYKLLWVFGFFSALLGQMGMFEFFASAGLSDVSVTSQFGLWIGLPGLIGSLLLTGINSLSFDIWVWLLWSFVFVTSFLVIGTFIAVVSYGAMIAVVASSVKKKTASVHMGKAWHTGVKHFWRLFFIFLAKKTIFAFLVLLMAVVASYMATGMNTADSLLFSVFFFVVMMLGMVVSFLVIYAACYIVVEEYPLGKAIAAGWRLFVDHWLVSLEIGLLLFFATLLTGLVSFVGLVVFFFPTLLLWFIAVLTGKAVLFTLGMVIGGAFFLLFVFLLWSFFQVFTVSVWTYLFMKMHKEGVRSRVIGFFQFLKKG